MKKEYFSLLAGVVALMGAPFVSGEDMTINLSDLSAFEYQPEVPESEDKVVRADKDYLLSFLPEEVLK